MKPLFHFASIRWLALLLLNPMIASSQEYSMKSIPEEVLEDTDLVIRQYTREFEVIDRGNGKSKVIKAITLLNRNARHHRTLSVGYDDLSKIESLQLKVFDANGELIKKYKSKDFDDVASYDGFSVYSDNRSKVLSVPFENYPYTIEYSYEIANKGLMFYPSHSFNSTTGPVERASFSIKIPSTLDLRYKLTNAKEPMIREEGESRIFSWEYEDLEKIEREPYAPPISEQYVRVNTSPIEFDMGGYQGRMDTWQGLAEFQRALNKDLDRLPPKTVNFVKSLTASANDDREKIQLVYDHLQNNFRYVSVQLGIGGWQPFNPSFVDESGYGDCKALSYYTKSMLESIGIKANYTLISAGDSFNALDPDFPTSNFNHVVLCVPNQGDTVWLECTSQTTPMGYSGYFTGNRKALMITDADGVIVNTPSYSMDDNLQIRTANAKIESNGQVELSYITKYTGLQYENYDLNIVLNQSDDDKKDWLYETIDLPGFDLKSFKFDQKRLAIPEAIVEVALVSNKIASKSGSRIIIEGNLLNKFRSVPPKVEDRKTDVMIRTPFFDSDSIWFELPAQSSIEYLPETVTIKSEFGEYKSEYANIDGRILYYRELQLFSGRFAPEKYEAFRTFRKEILEADDQKFIIKSIND